MPIAWPFGTPSGWSSSTNMPSRTPRPLSEIGMTWAIATTGTNAIDRADGDAGARS